MSFSAKSLIWWKRTFAGFYPNGSSADFAAVC
jgi:hypothetical protein